MDDKGFGIIAPDDGGNQIFVHDSAIQVTGLSTLEVGQRVRFDLVSDPSLSRAEKVAVVEE